MDKETYKVIEEISECVQYMQARFEYCSQEKKYVVMAGDQICVAVGEGLNGTSFTFKIPQTVIFAQLFNTVEDAEKFGADYFLQDGNGKRLEIKIVDAAEFFAKEIEWAKHFTNILRKGAGWDQWYNDPDNFIGAIITYNSDPYVIEFEADAMAFVLDIEDKEIVELNAGDEFENVKAKLGMDTGFEVDRVYMVRESSGQEYAYFCLPSDCKIKSEN